MRIACATLLHRCSLIVFFHKCVFSVSYFLDSVVYVAPMACVLDLVGESALVMVVHELCSLEAYGVQIFASAHEVFLFCVVRAAVC